MDWILRRGKAGGKGGGEEIEIRIKIKSRGRGFGSACGERGAVGGGGFLRPGTDALRDRICVVS
jgi:hypothetical protein